MSGHRLICINELLEMILLQTDLPPSDSLILQTLRRPIIPGQKRTQNPFLEDIWLRVWRKHNPPDLIRRYRKTPLPTPEEENAYRRKEASWQRMLLYQPPTSHIGIIETQGTERRPLFSEAVMKPYRDFLRLWILRSIIWRPHRVRGRGEPLVWCESGELYGEDRRPLAKCATIAAEYLADCDVVVIGRTLSSICGPSKHRGFPIPRTEFWVMINDFVGVLESRHRLDISDLAAYVTVPAGSSLTKANAQVNQF
ncbi:hypothetical protein P170DRAFT_479943 [Aspergillus steynii IBT 23096]|uniref:Uncharacterized protein n=1 Tax=Aspergillus steynii IBT 23096 TaxID=1392250 RepID=A0A2I2FUD1_9EURO|nr:uncharacterized protein P170DRAFT_479943 [Aspergillus steynii IBT 23096]PLB44176.1 hypothetical protein P170DRAFT_479943 [Aspergillus steynii IBT 23096]